MSPISKIDSSSFTSVTGSMLLLRVLVNSKPTRYIQLEQDVRNILRTGAPKMQMMAHNQWHVGLVKVQTFPRLIAEWGEDGYFGAKWAKGGPRNCQLDPVVLTVTTPHQRLCRRQTCITYCSSTRSSCIRSLK